MSFTQDAWFDAWTSERIRQVNQALDEACGAPVARLSESMRYSLLAGGKRVRPLLCIAACEAVGGTTDQAMPGAVALEMVHTFSLIHDDLPAMDDDDLRRGSPTNHKKFDEATAILAGDALQALAFRVLLRSGSPYAAEATESLADACLRMCAGQAADLAAEGSELDLEELRLLHHQKTGALLAASVHIGALLGGEKSVDYRLQALDMYSRDIGLAFQIVDDILDVTESSETLGKPANSDLKHDKATYPKLVGLDESRRLAREALSEALEALQHFDERAEPLRELARRIVERNA
ncbi:MAG: polyprenyl synthetase family protein [Armatimonas sp.]